MKRVSPAGIALTILLGFVISTTSLAAPGPGEFGRNFDEVVALARKEGKVLIGGGLADDESRMFWRRSCKNFPKSK